MSDEQKKVCIEWFFIVSVIGLGQTNLFKDASKTKFPRVLQKGEYGEVLSNIECTSVLWAYSRSTFDPVTAYDLCRLNLPDRSQPSYGDSGGPLILTQVGNHGDFK